ncbi:hypothetical protein YA31_00245 [Klebsiella aerogenes]|nr:hypothetical protein YA31_00245 [Klebsiella aerogenes]
MILWKAQYLPKLQKETIPCILDLYGWFYLYKPLSLRHSMTELDLQFQRELQNPNNLYLSLLAGNSLLI